jgi:hypothetical protein
MVENGVSLPLLTDIGMINFTSLGDAARQGVLYRSPNLHAWLGPLLAEGVPHMNKKHLRQLLNKVLPPLWIST